MSNRKPRIPSYRKHSSGQARVTIRGKDYLLGAYGTDESKEEYNRIVGEYLTSKGRFAPPSPEESAEPLTVAELILSYYKFAKTYYGWDDEPSRGDHSCTKDVLRVVRENFGSLWARDFGPKALKLCREKMIGLGWSRRYVNAQIGRVRRMFVWGAEEELIPGSVCSDLKTVQGLKRGKTHAREKGNVEPVPLDVVEKTIPKLSPTIAAMVRFQLVTGCRPAEVCMLRPDRIDRSNPDCWVFTPEKHKTEHHDKGRHILIGPRGRAIVEPFLDVPDGEYCFSPKRAEEQRQEQRRSDRKTKLWASHIRHQKNKRRRRPKRRPGAKYSTLTYRQAIHRACDNAGVERWGPNRLRHNRATELRRQAGLDVAKTVLGHSKVETTQIYAEKDLQAAMAIVSKHG